MNSPFFIVGHWRVLDFASTKSGEIGLPIGSTCWKSHYIRQSFGTTSARV